MLTVVKGAVQMLKKSILGGKTLNKVYEEMISSYKNRVIYDSLYGKFIKDTLGNKNINDLTSNDIDYFYIYLTNKTYNGHLYSKSYIYKIMNVLKKIFDYGMKRDIFILT